MKRVGNTGRRETNVEWLSDIKRLFRIKTQIRTQRTRKAARRCPRTVITLPTDWLTRGEVNGEWNSTYTHG